MRTSLLFQFLVLAGCAPRRSTLLEQRAATYVFHRSAAEVEVTVDAYFSELGFEWDAPGPDGVHPTAWKEVYGEWEFATVYQRYFILIRAKGPRHSTVEVVKLTRTTSRMETYHPQAPSGVGRDTKDVSPEQEMGKGVAPLPAGPPVAKRALDVEWELIRRLEPTRAAALEQRLDATTASR